MSAPVLRDHLAAFGLSEKEIDAYLAVLRAGSATTSDVADAAGISQGYVYDVVNTLANRDLVVVDESTNPTTIRARPPDEVVEGLESRLDELGSAIESEYGGGVGQAGFEVVHSRATVRRRARSAIESATEEAFVVVPAPEFEHLRDALAGAIDRGVFVYLMLVAPDVESVGNNVVTSVLDSLADPSDYADVLRVWDSTPPVFVLADETRGVMGSHGVLSGRHGDETALAFVQPEIGSGFLGNVLSNIWPMGTTRYCTDPDPLPTTYPRLRTAVTNAALHRATGRDLAVDLLAESLDTGEQERFENAPVLEVRQSLVGEPTTDFPMENSLVFDVDGDARTVGNIGGGFYPFLEDYGAIEVTLRERDG